MSYLDKLKRKSLHLMLLIGLVIATVIPAYSWASAQDGSAPIWVVRSLSTSEYGVADPKGLAFSPEANTFLILDGSATVTQVTMGEEHAGTRNIPEAQTDPLNAAFDKKSGSLFVFNRGKSELVQIRTDGKGLPARFSTNAFGITDPQGLAFDPGNGQLFILDAGSSQIVSIAAHPTLGFDANEAMRANKVKRISLKKLGVGLLRGIAYNPGNGHLYIIESGKKKLYELTQSGDLVSTFDLASLSINNPSALTFAPSVDSTDDPGIYDLFLLDRGKTGLFAPVQQATASGGQIVELSLQAPAALPSGTTLLPASLVHIIDTSKAAWSPSAPDPAGVDYWPLTGRLLIADSEVEEMSAYWMGKNVFQSTTSGTLGNTCSTISYTGEPTGVAINPVNNHIFFSTDFNDRVFEVSLGADGQYCTTDDTVTTTDVYNLYNITDAEDVAYGNNTLFIAGGDAAEVYRIPLGANGVLGGGDDGAMTHFDTAALGFGDLEALGYNADAGTLFIASPRPVDRYLGETTITGTLLRAYDLSLMGSAGNIRSDVTYAPGSQNPAVKNIYIASRGVDNDSNRLENDGQIWEISLGSPPGTVTLSPTSSPTPTPTPTLTPPSASSTWYIRGIGSFVFGTNSDTPVPADYNGDGKDDMAVFQPSSSTWHISGSGSSVFGTSGDTPVVADYNGDGRDDIAVFQPSSGTWSIHGAGSLVYGISGDIPVPADYNGDGRDDIAIFRPSNSTWYIYGVGPFVYGINGDIPVVADYNSDGKADIAVFRPSNSTWYVYGIGPFIYGTVGDLPVVADYNGDGRDDIAVFRPSNSTWYVYGIGPFVYGTSGDTPVVGDYNGDRIDDIAVFRP
jgi:VCBS repeat protein